MMLGKHVICSTILLLMVSFVAWGVRITPSWRPDPSLHHYQYKATVASPRPLTALEYPLYWVNEDEVLSGEMPSCLPRREDHYWIVNVRTGRRRDLPTVQDHDGIVTLHPHLSPDGKWLDRRKNAGNDGILLPFSNTRCTTTGNPCTWPGSLAAL